MLHLLAMLATIELHDELGLGTNEVHDVHPQRNLAPEPEASRLAIAQEAPKQAFGVGGTVAQFPRE